VFEVTSFKSRREDEVHKPLAYAKAGIAEYFIFDPLDEYLSPRLQGFRLGSQGYETLACDGDGRLASQELGLSFQAEEGLLRAFDLQTGAVLPSLDELDEQADTERLRAEAESRRADAESRRAAALEEELKRLRGQIP
jgi:Uma2 family endonuclease